jgi:uncharacterized protein YwqG
VRDDAERVAEALRRAGLADIVERVRPHARPSVRLRRAAADDAEIPVGATKFGGSPDLPAGTPWPMRDRRPLGFVGQVALAANGVYCGNRRAYDEALAKALRARKAEWRLLLQVDQVDSDEPVGMMWGDLGRLYFMMRDEDLRAGRFDRVWLELQCT